MRVINYTIATVLVSLAIPGVSAAQTATDPLGAQSASQEVNATPDEGGTLPEFGSGGPNGTAPDEGAGAPEGGTLPVSQTGGPEANATGSSGSQGSSLPFTGFMAIPVLLAGLMLLGSGLVVRSRSTA